MENDARFAFGLFLMKHSIQSIQWRNNRAWLKNKHGRFYGDNISDIIPFVVKPFENENLIGRIGQVSRVNTPRAYFKMFIDGSQLIGLDMDESTKLFFEHFEWSDDVCQILKL